MNNLVYFGLWIAAALVGIAFFSSWLAQYLRVRDLRRQQGLLLLDALERYCEWVVAQRRAPVFLGESNDAAQALDDACTIRLGWFPELAADMAELLGLHARLLDFLTRQDALRHSDAEAWLETDHDGRFMALWRHQHALYEAMQAKLFALAGATLETQGAEAPGSFARQRSVA